MALRPEILLALGLSACVDPQQPVLADLDRQARGADTCATGDTGDVTPCLSVQACLCACETGTEALWLAPAVGLLAVARRRRSEVLSTLPDDVRERIEGTDDPE